MRDELFKLLGPNPMSENRPMFLAALIARHGMHDGAALTLHHAAAVTRALLSLATAIKAHAEAECSREVTEAEERRDERNQDRFTKIAKMIGFEATTGGDPRGSCAFIKPVGKKAMGDDMGERGFGVYR